MSRPEISVVMPFAGSAEQAREAIEALRALEVKPGDELILVDNGHQGIVPDGDPRVTVVTARGEHSPAFARNVGAAQASNDWILFLDADTRPPSGLLDALWGDGVEPEVGALAGEIVASSGAMTLAGRYGSARGFLSQEAHHAHPYRPRAAAANLLVRRVAFEQLGGFYEGVRAAEDTDFTWRLQEAGWQLALRGQAAVEHRYRTSVRELRRQWRGYAAGRAWLARRYDGFVPEPALRRALQRGVTGPRPRAGAGPPAPRHFILLDGLLAFEELFGFGLSNRPPRSPTAPAAVVLVADRFPGRDDPLVELAGSLEHVRVEAIARPIAVDVASARQLAIDYLEDDGAMSRWSATAMLLIRHPWRTLLDLARRSPDEPPLSVLAPAVRRLERDPGARLHVLGVGRSRAIAARLARLARRPLD